MNKQLAAEGKAPFQWKTVPQGASTSVWAGVVASADEIGGRYCENCYIGNVVPDDVTISDQISESWLKNESRHPVRKSSTDEMRVYLY
jgi:hypothetical protein